MRRSSPYTIEEAYEVADAITRGDFDDLREELGDLLLQVVYHARMAEEQNAFAFGDVVEAITRKMIRRHPHVFADKDGNIAPAGVKSAWERIKAEEKAERAARRPPEETTHKSLLSGVKAGQPALTRAMELQRKASTVGFDWNDPRAVLSKIREEADEIEAALDNGNAEELAEETGDLLFALVNLARHVGADPESALRGTNAKFERRFAYIERALAAKGRSLEEATLEEMDALWNEAKAENLSCQRTQGPIPRDLAIRHVAIARKPQPWLWVPAFAGRRQFTPRAARRRTSTPRCRAWSRRRARSCRSGRRGAPC